MSTQHRFFSRLSLILVIMTMPALALRFGWRNKPTTRGSSESATIPLLETLDEEIATLGDLIRLQSDRLQRLERLRQQVAKARAEEVGDYSAGFQWTGSAFHPSCTDYGGGARSTRHIAEDYLIRLGALSPAETWDEAVEEGAQRGNVHVTAIKMLSFQCTHDLFQGNRGGILNILAVACTNDEGGQPQKREECIGDGTKCRGRNSWLSFYDLHGDLIGSYIPLCENHSVITTLAFEMLTSDEAMLVVGAQDGSLSLHRVQLWRKGQTFAGKQPFMPSISSSIVNFPNMPHNTTSKDGLGIHVVHEGTLQLTDQSSKEAAHLASISCVLLHKNRAHGLMIISGNKAGKIQAHLRNGTLFKTVSTGQPIYAMIRHRNVLFYTAGSDVKSLNAKTLEQTTNTYCGGQHGALHSLVVDSLVPQILHAATAQGDLLTFRLMPKSRRSQPYQSQHVYADTSGAAEGSCKLIKKFASRSEGDAPLSLAMLPGGYLLAVSARGSLFSWNTTGLHNTYLPLPLLFHLKFAPIIPSGRADCASNDGMHLNNLITATEMTASEGGTAFNTRSPSNFVILMGKPSNWNLETKLPPRDHVNEIVIFEALLPHQRSQPLDLSWIRVYFMIIAVGLVFAWHCSKGGRNKRPGLAGLEGDSRPAHLNSIGMRPHRRHLYNLTEDDEYESEKSNEADLDGSPSMVASIKDEQRTNLRFRKLSREQLYRYDATSS